MIDDRRTLYEMFTKDSTQKMWPAGVEVYSPESLSSLSFLMSLNSFVTPFSASSRYWNFVSRFLNSGKGSFTPEVAERLIAEWLTSARGRMRSRKPNRSHLQLQQVPRACACRRKVKTRYKSTSIKNRIIKYLVRVSEIGRYFSWRLLCDRTCPVQPPAFFLSRVLLLGFGKLLSNKEKCHCRFVVMCVGFTTNCQNKSQSKSRPPDIHPLLSYFSTTHTVALAGTCTSLNFSRWNLTFFLWDVFYTALCFGLLPYLDA